MNVEFTATFEFDETAALERLGLESGGFAQQTLDKAVIDFCQPYIPFDSGTLAVSAYSATKIGSGEVIWPGPYAHYQYMGEVYGPNIPVFEDNTGNPTRFFSPPKKKKHPTGRKMKHNKGKNPQAGPFWVERMKADHMNDILREVQNVIGK